MTNSRKIKVLVIDDSAFMRKTLTFMLESAGDIEVIATAKDGPEGYEMIRKYQPDVVTLDFEMPGLNGLETLEKIMKDCPVPVLMVSSFTTAGADITIKALSMGAVDFLSKEPSSIISGVMKIKDELIYKIRNIYKQNSIATRLKRISNISVSGKQAAKQKTDNANWLPAFEIKAILIGISTGGPLSLQKVIPHLHAQLPVPVIIVQHMPPMFTFSLADRLNKLSELTVKEASNEDVLEPSKVYFAPGGKHLLASHSTGFITLKISDIPDNTLYKPSVDVTLNSLIDIYGKSVLPVIMTGMGKDGLEAVKRIKQIGGYAIAQDEESSVVYGMPRAIVDNNLADLILPLDKIAFQINKIFNYEYSNAGNVV
ncbi:chemotaxis response regulator protein-glutamate methylesterase [Ignavibacterium album]|uniref:protein-glutamate methylesterase/protein-glutamine glutaminase n=1 Tax=Ignavibacterium album TaxID=591197 RepID=UPI0035B9D8E3